jgi:hypothetical protein
VTVAFAEVVAPVAPPAADRPAPWSGTPSRSRRAPAGTCRGTAGANILPSMSTRPRSQAGPPMTLGNMRANGVRSLDVSCWQCHHHRATLSAEPWPDEVPIPAFRLRMVCTQCGIIGADARAKPSCSCPTFLDSNHIRPLSNGASVEAIIRARCGKPFGIRATIWMSQPDAHIRGRFTLHL